MTQVITTTHVDEAILAPFAFFDKPVGPQGQPVGHLKREQVEAILHSMGVCPRRFFWGGPQLGAENEGGGGFGVDWFLVSLPLNIILFAIFGLSLL